VIVGPLVDIVSKNGTYLLNAGPHTEDVILEPMRERLRQVRK